MEPTSEQMEAMRLFGQGGALKVNAFAGTGKTTTPQLLAGATNRRGLYLAFNRSIAEEAKRRFGSNVVCSTVNTTRRRGILVLRLGVRHRGVRVGGS